MKLENEAVQNNSTQKETYEQVNYIVTELEESSKGVKEMNKKS